MTGYGMTGYEFEQHALDLRAALETVFMTITFGDMLGLPVIPPSILNTSFPLTAPALRRYQPLRTKCPSSILNTARTRYTIAA